jgi:hypothetical protein
MRGASAGNDDNKSWDRCCSIAAASPSPHTQIVVANCAPVFAHRAGLALAFSWTCVLAVVVNCGQGSDFESGYPRRRKTLTSGATRLEARHMQERRVSGLETAARCFRRGCCPRTSKSISSSSCNGFKVSDGATLGVRTV